MDDIVAVVDPPQEIVAGVGKRGVLYQKDEGLPAFLKIYEVGQI